MDANYLDNLDMEAMAAEATPEPSAAMVPSPPPIPLYQIPTTSLAGAPPQPGGVAEQPGVVGLATRQVGPLPVWAWALIGGGVIGTGYFAMKGRGVEKNESSESKAATPSIGDVIARAVTPNESSSGGWAPSRSRFAEQLQRYVDKKGLTENVTVWHDADDAKKAGMAFVSPLINIQVKSGGVKPDAAMTRFCRREGLDPKAHQDGNIGLYPHSTKRGKEWEEYIDALRDDGQNV